MSIYEQILSPEWTSPFSFCFHGPDFLKLLLEQNLTTENGIRVVGKWKAFYGIGPGCTAEQCPTTSVSLHCGLNIQGCAERM